MKKVLIIGQIWPYHVYAGNAVPPLAKYLPNGNWEPVVLTTPLPNIVELNYEVIEVPFRDPLTNILRWLGFNTDKSIKNQVSLKLNVSSKKSILDLLFRILNELLTYPAPLKNWINPALKSAIALIENEEIEAIICELPPISGLLIANKLKQKYPEIPWIVYCTHFWSQNNGYPYGSFRKVLDQRLEVKTLSSSDIMITTSQPLVEKLGNLHKNKRIIYTHQGFDQDTVNYPPVTLNEKFTITYAGSFAPNYREPTMLLTALHNLIEKSLVESRNINVQFYGQEEVWIEAEIQKLNLAECVKQYGRISLVDSHEKQRESHILFNPKWDDPDEPGIYSGKIYEYLAARRPILATGKFPDVVDDLIRDTCSGITVYSIEEIENYLLQKYVEYKETGTVQYLGNLDEINKYTYQEMTKTFISVLNELTHKKNS